MEREAKNLAWFFGSFVFACFVGVTTGCAQSKVPASCGGLGIASNSPALILWTQSVPR